MKTIASVKRMVMFARGLFLQRFIKEIIQYFVIASVFIISVSLWILAIKLSLVMSSPTFILSILDIICGITALLCISKSFLSFHDRKTSSLIITFPVSSLEKYCAILIFYFVTHILVVSIIIVISKILICSLAEFMLGFRHVFGSWIYGNIVISKDVDSYPLASIIRSVIDFIRILGMLFCYFFAASIFFRKNQFIKGGLLIWSLYVLQGTVVLFFQMRKILKIYGGNSPYFLEYFTNFLYNEYSLLIGGIFLIIIAYFRFSKIQYR